MCFAAISEKRASLVRRSPQQITIASVILNRERMSVSKLTRAATFAALLSGNVFAQSISAKLDHVVIAVRNLEAAKRLYSQLGFVLSENGRHPTGTENSAIFLRDGYLELIAPYDTSLSGGPLGGGHGYAEYLKQGEGARAAGLEIASAGQTARDLRAAGLKIKGPNAGTISRPGEKQPPPPRWWTISFVDQLPARPFFLIQYATAPAPTNAAAAEPPSPANPNSASSLSSLLVVVDDLESAAAAYRNIGKNSDREIPLPEFGAAGKEIILERGSIFLLRAIDPSGAAARRLRARGEGILAVRLGVTDLEQARRSIAGRNVSKDKRSVLVSPENAAGVWLEFQTAHR